MDFELDDLLMDTVMGISKTELSTILSKIDEKKAEENG